MSLHIKLFSRKTINGDRMNIRTDLALERREMHTEEPVNGVRSYEFTNSECKATVIEIISSEGENTLQKPMGKYITLEMRSFPDSASLTDGRLEMLIEMLDTLIPKRGTVLIAGLGNPDITPDSVGPKAAGMILATRHIEKETRTELNLPELRDVCAMSPDVTGKTGIETVEMISGIKDRISPSCIVIIDALAARSVKRLGTTVQLCDTGIEPGSGVGNRRKAINKNTMGIPVIAIGIPTVADASTFCYDLTGQSARDSEFADMMVTPKDTDMMTTAGAKLISLALNLCLQKNLTKEEIISLTMP